MKILILGSKGNLGSQLVKVFKNQKITAWDKSEIDITDKVLIIKKISDIKPNIIINAAAYNAVDKCEASDEEFVLAKRINGEAVGYLAQAALEYNSLLVYYSSDYVFKGDKKYGYIEEDIPDPINKYGESKLLGEKEILKLSGKGLRWQIIRTSKLFGPKSKSPNVKPSFFDLMLKLSKEKKELDIVDEEVSCFTYTPDLAEATKNLLEAGKANGIYHLTNSGAVTWYEAAEELFKIANIKIKINKVTVDKFPRPAKRPKYSVLINTKLPQLRDYREALKEYINL